MKERIRSAFGWFGLVAFVVIVAFAAVRGCQEVLDEDMPPPFQPVRILNLNVAPAEVRVGDQVILENGVCNDADVTLRLQVWLGAEEVVDDPVLPGRSISLIGAGDTAEQRERSTIEPGCHGTEGFPATVPASLSVGTWRMVAHVVVVGPEGQVQDIVRRSEPFRVLGDE